MGSPISRVQAKDVGLQVYLEGDPKKPKGRHREGETERGESP